VGFVVIDGQLTTISLFSALVIRVSSQYNHFPFEAMKAVSDERVMLVCRFPGTFGDTLTVTAAQASKMVCDTVQVILVRWHLGSRVV
jgi:hypothetical protein